MVAARFGLAWADGVIGVAVSGVILWAAVRIAKESVTPLLGEAPTEEELAEIEAKALEVQGVRGVHDIIVHKYGETRVISLHIETSEDLSARDLHKLSEEVERRVDTQGHGLVVVHVDPINLDHPRYTEVKALLREAVRCDGRLESFHDFRLEGDDEAFEVQVDVAVHETLSESCKEEIEASLEARLHERFPRARLRVSFEPVFAYGESAQRRPER
jgi:divalent metal cation (Fe/Co/Zn/Cd) transporter